MKRAIEFHANGKLLITGEYLVLVGSRALALPVRFGQQMTVHETTRKVVEWESSAQNGLWFSARFDPRTLNVISAVKKKTATELKKVLAAARRLNPDFLTGSAGWKVSIKANYPLAWGLGSSSTLCSLIAGWAGVPVYDLFRMISQGSGYDIACASRPGLLYYQLRKGRPEIASAEAGKALRENTYFAYLGNKQDTNKEVTTFLVNQNYSDIDLVEISRLSTEICEAVSADELMRLVNEHEFLLSTILKREPIARRFRSFQGTVKSLGAWGGDFAMFVSGQEPVSVVNQLHGMGFVKVFSYSDLEIKS